MRCERPLSRRKGRLNVPYFVGILRNCAITGEIAGAGHIEHGFGGPGCGLLEVFFRTAAGFNVGRQVSQMEVTVTAVQQLIHNLAEEARLVWTKPV